MTQSWASTPAVRRNMQAIRGRDTQPELALRQALHAAGLRFRVCVRPVPEIRRTADIVFRPSRVAVEVRGCFWHGCPDHYRPPISNERYWATKIARNIERDNRIDEELARYGWRVITVWEHDEPTEAADHIAQVVRSRRGIPSRGRNAEVGSKAKS